VLAAAHACSFHTSVDHADRVGVVPGRTAGSEQRPPAVAAARRHPAVGAVAPGRVADGVRGPERGSVARCLTSTSLTLMPQFSPVVAPELQTHMPLIVGEMSVTVRIASGLSPGPPDHMCADVPGPEGAWSVAT